MQTWLESCEDWLTNQYESVLDINLGEGTVRLRWLSVDSLTKESERVSAGSLVIEDEDIGWLLFLIPYNSEYLEHQLNQALSLRSRLLRESNYTGDEIAGEKEDQNSTWRIGIVWLVEENDWDGWQQKITELRRESGIAEELSFDAVSIKDNDVQGSLNNHGLPRLLLNTRALMQQTFEETEKWLSADSQISLELRNFSQKFTALYSCAIARELEEKSKTLESFESIEQRPASDMPRQLQSFGVQHFRNLDALEVIGDRPDETNARAIIMFGPNGTGKSSFAEALSLAAFETSPRLEQFMSDKDVKIRNSETYLKNYLTPLEKSNAQPSFTWGQSGIKKEFVLNPDEASKSRYEGVILSQEDSIKFTDLSREELATQVLTGYSSQADKLSEWLADEVRRANEKKLIFTRKYRLNRAITRSSTAYNRLASSLLSDQLQRPSLEFIDWLRFLERLAGDNRQKASKLISAWSNQQNTVVERLADSLAKLQESDADQLYIAKAIQEELDRYDALARISEEFKKSLVSWTEALREQFDDALTQIDAWGEWLVSQRDLQGMPDEHTGVLKTKIEKLSKERSDLEKKGKSLSARLDLLDQTKEFLASHWVKQCPNICPVCNSNVTRREGIETVVSVLQKETISTIQTLRVRHAEIQKKRKELDVKLKATGMPVFPLETEDRARLEKWLRPLLPENELLEDWLADSERRKTLKHDFSRMRILPEAPTPYGESAQESKHLATIFIERAREADSVLEASRSIRRVKRVFEQTMGKILINHLPTTLGKVWEEISLTLTTAPWLLPYRANMKPERQGKSLSVQVGETGRNIRYIYNAAERHSLGLAWFFTYYLAKKRFDEAWMLLDDPAQEMDQPSFREFVRFLETLLRLHKKKNQPLTMIVALHQEERALDAARSTNGRMYILGWQKRQEYTSNQSSVKKIVLLAPGYHPLKPKKMFN